MAFFRKWKTPYKHKKFTSEDFAEANERNSNFTKFRINGSSNTKDNLKSIISDDDEDNKPIFGSYDIKYLGCTPIESKRSEKVTSEAIKLVIANSKAGGRKEKTLKRVTLNVSQDGVEVLDQQSKDTLMRFSIYQISYCSVDGAHDHTFSFVSSEPNPLSEQEQLSCHVFQCPKRKVANEITLMVAKCFESAYHLWRDTVVQNSKTQRYNIDKNNAGKILKEHNKFEALKMIESNAEVHEQQNLQNQNQNNQQSNDERNTDNLLIDFAVTNNSSSSNCGGNNIQTFHGNNWVSFEDDLRDHDKNHLANF